MKEKEKKGMEGKEKGKKDISSEIRNGTSIRYIQKG